MPGAPVVEVAGAVVDVDDLAAVVVVVEPVALEPQPAANSAAAPITMMCPNFMPQPPLVLTDPAPAAERCSSRKSGGLVGLVR